MKLINIGFGNMVSAGGGIALLSPGNAPPKRMGREGRGKGKLNDAPY